MTSGMSERRRHFLLEGVTHTEAFRPGGRGSRKEIRGLERVPHGASLRSQLQDVRSHSQSASISQLRAGASEGFGTQVEFEGFPGVELAFQQLSNKTSGIELLNVRVEGTSDEDRVTRATVFVPDGKLDHFERLIRDYLDGKQDSLGRPRDNQRIVDAISSIRAATLRALWTDTEEFPENAEGALWWEVWLPLRSGRQHVLLAFRNRVDAIGEGVPASVQASVPATEPASASEDPEGTSVLAVQTMSSGEDADHRMRVSPGELHFPERSVVLIRATVSQMEQSLMVLNSIAELRRPRETAEFFVDLGVNEQAEWLDELLLRSQYPSEDAEVPYVCILDTGVNRGHKLIEPALAHRDQHTVQPGWGTADVDGHGTGMAGLALAGDMTDLVLGTGLVCYSHRLESVKLLPQRGSNHGDPQHHGYLTEQAVYAPEIYAPDRLRVFGMAVTSKGNGDRGRPSAWSAAIDSLAADVPENGERPRLMVLSAGNIEDNESWRNYPYSNETDSIHDPAQAWNALTVGAYTELTDISEDLGGGHSAIAPKGDLSPFSTTSLVWDPRWPMKPDVVLEGGNVAMSPNGPIEVESLSLLTSYYQPNLRLFAHFNATSAATALASRLAAQVMAEYPSVWPETVRALIVHSAEWTDGMKESCLPNSGRVTKAHYGRLIRKCGFGVPDLDRALWSLSNSLTMVIQDRLHPFRREGSKNPTFRDMNLHTLPWPVSVLESLGDVPVEMRVTLSYFIEPNPSARGTDQPYRYESHGLRFDVKRPYETVEDFRSRINLAAREEEGDRRQRSDGDPAWLIGKQQRHRGSLHGDIWRGTAAELASLGYVAVYPTSGWWRTRPALERYDKWTRYALVVSISAPETNVDLYAEVASQISAPVEIET